MDFTKAVQICFKKYGNPQGRAQRSEFWYWILFIALVSVGTQIVDDTLDTEWVNALSGLLLFVPSLMVLIRRMHDQDLTGWMALWMILPFFGMLILLYYASKPGTQGPNRFGRDPLNPDGSSKDDLLKNYS